MLSIIVAVANNNVIGKDNKLIWHLPEDLKRFKALTTGHTIIMGRKTFESLGRVLPNRKHIVLCNDVNLNIENETFKLGLEELISVVKYIRIFGVPDTHFKVDLTIARGLDYYTGTVYETFLNDYRELGSVCSGGRYENLAEYYTDKKLPGVGISIGLTRLFYKLNELGLIKAEKASMSDVLVIPMVDDLSKPIILANSLREKNINTEIYLNDKKLKAKLKYADKLQIPYVIIVGEDEINSGVISVKNMITGEEKKANILEDGKNINVEEIVSIINQ